MSFSIGREVLDTIRGTELQPLATGGGLDFVAYQPDHSDCTFLVENKSGCGPQTLDEPANILFFVDSEWRDWLSIPFNATQTALEALQSQDFRRAVAIVATGVHQDQLRFAGRQLPLAGSADASSYAHGGELRVWAEGVIQEASGAFGIAADGGHLGYQEYELLSPSPCQHGASGGPSL